MISSALMVDYHLSMDELLIYPWPELSPELYSFLAPQHLIWTFNGHLKLNMFENQVFKNFLIPSIYQVAQTIKT